jgi:putative membrane protein
MMNGWGFGGTGAWLMVLLSIVAVAVIAGVVFLVRGLGGSGTAGDSTPPQAGPRESPQDILKRRYAAGEIDREEYEKALSDLRS